MNKPWWSKKWGRDKICGIRQARLRPYRIETHPETGEKIRVKNDIMTLNCGHRFYQKEWLQWIPVSQKLNNGKIICAMCRQEWE